MMHYLDMGGFAAFIWPSYALSVLAITTLTVWVLRADRRAHDMLKRIEQGENRNRQAVSL